MARDSVTVDFLLETRKADKDLARIRKEMEKLSVVSSKAFKGLGGGAGGGEKIRALGTGLSKATVRADEFTKSLEASNARVVAFGASAGIIMQIDRAFKAMVTSTIKVEKALLDVNVVLNATQKNLKQFGNGMFQISKQTAQGFDTVAEAATELARQGLGMEKTLTRTKDALILTRLTGMDAAEAVKSLTAAVNSFNKEGVTSAQVINKMAKVDAAFAVSSEDLAKAISRVGASAVSAGVSMDELLAITTAVQQRTARGGAVIGNAFKTIFTRIQRTDVLQKLRNIGVAVTDMEGRMLSGIQVIQNLANNFDNLSKAQQASVSESVAGVFQVNILKAAMSDLSSATSNYNRALKVSSGATDEAYRRNEQLNQSLDALINRTLANLTQAGASLGGGALEPAIRKTLGFVNSAIESFGKGGAMEGFGETFGKGIVDGIGKFIAGPGIAGITATIGVLFFKLTKFTSKAFADIMGINKASQQRAALEDAIVKTMAAEPKLLQQVLNKEVSILSIEQQILNTIRKQNLERAAMQRIAAPIAGSLVGRGTRISRSGGVVAGGAATGYVPNFANAGAERAAAAAGGYSAGAIRTINQPGAGRVMYNSAETVKRFPGMSQSAIMPPRNSPAGAGYKAAFGAAHGFNPYAAEGFIPNFRKAPTRDLVAGKKLKGSPISRISLTGPGGKGKQDIGVLLAEGSTSTGISYKNKLKDIPGLQAALAASPAGAQLLTGELGKRLTPETLFTSYGIPAVSMFPMSMQQAEKHTDGKIATSSLGGLQKALDRYKDQVGAKLFGKYSKGAGNPFNVKALSKGTEGDIFEEAVRAAAQGTSIVRTAAFDFDGPNYAPPALMDFMKNEGANLNLSASKVEAKIGNEAAISGNIPKKIVNDLLDGDGKNVGYYKSLRGLIAGIKGQSGLKGKIAASGFIPNFNPLASAVGREMAAGVPSSAIRVGSSNSLKSPSNPGGLGVYNTIHEPGGLAQGVSRARASGINPKSHGIPNYALLDEFGRPIDASSGKAGRSAAARGRGGVLAKSIDDLIKSTKKSTRATVESTAATTKTGGIFKGLGARLGGGGALGLGLLVPMVTGTLRAKGVGTEQGTGAAMAMGAVENAAMFGGTGAMIHPLLGVAGFLGGGLYGALAGAAEEASDSVEELNKQLEKVSSREDRTAETFGRIADEMDRINAKAFGNDRTRGLQGQRTLIKDFLRKEYGVGDPKTGEITVSKGLQQDLDAIDKALTGKEMQDIAEKVRKRGVSGVRTLQVQKALAQAGETNAAGVVTVGRGIGMFGGRGGISPMSVARGPRQTPLADLEFGPGNRRGFTSSFVAANSEAFRKRQQLVAEPGIRGGVRMGIPFQVPTEGKGVKSLVSAAQVMMGAGARTSGLGFAEEIFFDKGTSKGKTTIAGREVETMLFNRAAAEAALTERLSGLRGLVDSPLTARGRGNRGVGLLINSIMDLAGVDEGDKATVGQSMMNEAQSIAEDRRNSGIAGFKDATAMEVLKEMAHEILNKPYSELDDLHSKHIEMEEKRLAAAEKAIIEYEKNIALYRKESLLLNQFGNSLRMATLEAKHYLNLQKESASFTNKSLRISQSKEMSFVRSTGSPIEVAREARRQSIQTASAANMAARVGALDQTQFAAGEAGRKALLNIRKDIIKDLLEGTTGLSKEVLKSRREALSNLGLDTLQDKSVDELKAVIKTMNSELADLMAKAGLEGSDEALVLSEGEKTRLTSLQELTPALEGIVKNFDNQVSLADKRLENAKKIANLTEEQQMEEIQNRMQFNTVLRDFNQLTAYMLAQQEAVDARRLSEQGRITGAGLTSRYKSAMEARRNRFGLGDPQEEMGKSVMMGFRGEMTYNDRSYLDDLEDGSRSVAASMKSSFADAFKSIASGATDARSAIVQFADGILNTISDVTARIGTNMLFSGMGFSQGGLVPGYNRGGIVTGGSGYKDDVPAMMNGGEFVIKKSAAQKIGYGTLNAINSGGAPSYNAGGMFALSAGASMLSGAINQTGQGGPSATRGQDYGQGRGAYGYFGGADVNATRPSSMSGGSQSAAISLSKGFNFYRRDPATGRLISERSRPTEGGFDVSSALSLQGALNADDPQTARMFAREKAMGDYGNYLDTETARRKEVMRAHEGKKRGRLISAYANAAMLIGGSYFMNRNTIPDLGGGEGHVPGTQPGEFGFVEKQAFGGSMGGASPALLMGGEYVMSPDTVRTHGLGFMNELNRGNVPSYAGGGIVGGAGGTNNNVNISVNVDRRGNATVDSSASNDAKESDQQEMQKNKEFGAALQTVVLQEIMKQQRPGGLLQNSN